jgi:hypothetical protein
MAGPLLRKRYLGADDHPLVVYSMSGVKWQKNTEKVVIAVFRPY